MKSVLNQMGKDYLLAQNFNPNFFIVDFSSPTWAVCSLLVSNLPHANNFLAAVGTSPGRLVETDAKFNIIAEHPKDVAGLTNILGEQFSPHGLTVDWEKNIILTSDFVVPISILKPSLGIVRANTLRLWNLASRTIISTITIPDVINSPSQFRDF